MTLQDVAKALEKNRYQVQIFSTKEEANQYLNQVLDRTVIGFGDSETLSQMKLYESLSTHNQVIDPKQSTDNDDFLRIAKACLAAEVFVTSVNGLSETGVLVNLEQSGLIRREEYETVPPRVEYSLTESGRSLIPALEIIGAWGRKKMAEEHPEHQI
ncbi:MAG: winged helix-turn-helix transcriptional regulator [Peptococcaceae bacterium]